MDKATAEKMVKDFSRLVRRHMAEEDDPDGNYEYEKEVKRKMEQAAESIVEALTTPPAKPQGEVSVETAFAEGYYVGFADGVGPGLELEAAWDNFKKKFQPTVAARVPPEADHLPDPKKVIPPKLSEAIAWATDHLENTGHDDDERFIYLKSLHDPANMQSKPAEPLHYGLLEAAKAFITWNDDGDNKSSPDKYVDHIREAIAIIEAQSKGTSNENT